MQMVFRSRLFQGLMTMSLVAMCMSAPALAQTDAKASSDAATQTNKLMETGHRLSPVDMDASKSVETFDASKSTNAMCGLLQYHSDENGWFHFKGVANGSLIVNFSEGGVIRSRMQENIVQGAWHHYDTKNYRYQLGFTCL